MASAAWFTTPSALRYSSADRGFRQGAVLALPLIRVSGVRSSWEASAVKRRCCSKAVSSVVRRAPAGERLLQPPIMPLNVAELAEFVPAGDLQAPGEIFGADLGGRLGASCAPGAGSGRSG